MARRFEFVSVPPIVLARMMAVMLLLAIGAFYFIGQSIGLIPPIYGEKVTTPEERRALAKHNAEVKRLIATRDARAVAVGAADHAEQVAQAARDAPPPVPKPVVSPEPVSEASQAAE